MADLAHLWGNDLSWSPTGDLAVTDTPGLTQQRVLRRLLTVPGDYIWSMPYGAGLARVVGQPGADKAIVSTVRSQVLQEANVAATPAPIIQIVPDQVGDLYIQVTYTDAVLGTSQTIAFFA